MLKMLRFICHEKAVKYCSTQVTCIRLKSFLNQDDYQYWQKSRIPTMHFQKSLPRLPIPELAKTCERYLNAQRPLLDESNFGRTKDIVQRFLLKDGIDLQKELKDQDARNKGTSYISEPWFEMYLRDRTPLPINYNPLLVFIDDPKKEYNAQLIRTTNLLISSLRFLKSLQENILEPEVFHLNPKKSDTALFRTVTKMLPASISWYGAYLFKAFPLDMSQYEGLFNATRIPKREKDQIFRNATARHVLVMRRGNFYTFDVLDQNGNIKKPEKIVSCLKHILNDTSSVNRYPLGILTTENRDVWADAREHLESCGNAEALRLVDSSLFCICLDDECVGENPELITRTFLHSDGVNRWFDKSFSLLVAKDGKAAVNFEHSWGDGVAVLRYFQDVYKDSTSNPWIHPDSKMDEISSSVVHKIEFHLDDKLKNSIKVAKEKYLAFTKSLALSFFEFPTFGKQLCKQAHVSPDSVMQLGFQLAYNKLTGTYVGTYESCSTAAFKHGRTETMRPCTSATKEFCEALKALHKPNPLTLKKMLSNCSRIHGNLIKEAAMGQGFDRHLFGLRKLAEKRGITLPEIYQDPAYAFINHSVLSTSTLSSDVVHLGGFGPVVRDGFGIGYSIFENRLGAVISYYAGHSDGCGFKQCLENAFQDIHRALLAKEV